MVTLNRHSTRVGCVLRIILAIIGALAILLMVGVLTIWLRGEFEFEVIFPFIGMAAIAYACLRITITGNALFFKKLIMNYAESERVQVRQDRLIKAISKGDTEKVHALLEKGADVNTRGNDGFTALDMAAGHGHTDIVQALLSQGADMNAKDNDGITALMGAAFEGHTDTVHALLEKGADVNAKDNNGGTALMRAAQEGQTDTLQALLANGADVNAKINDGGTALKKAKEGGHEEIVRILKEAGAME
jgi:ankyrin repeat protein